MKDHELLALAAKAAGVHWSSWDYQRIIESGRGIARDMLWNPFTDDGTAQRLAVKLNMHVMRFDNMTTVRVMGAIWTCDERDNGDANAATRRAIVRVAAELGKAMP